MFRRVFGGIRAKKSLSVDTINQEATSNGIVLPPYSFNRPDSLLQPLH